MPSQTSHSAKEMTELVFSKVYQYYSLLNVIVSDHDVLFINMFWKHLHKLLGVKLCMFSAYHLQSNDSTKSTNWTVMQMLRQCVSPNQKDWVLKLSAIEFAINLAY